MTQQLEQVFSLYIQHCEVLSKDTHYMVTYSLTSQCEKKTRRQLDQDNHNDSVNFITVVIIVQ